MTYILIIVLTILVGYLFHVTDKLASSITDLQRIVQTQAELLNTTTKLVSDAINETIAEIENMKRELIIKECKQKEETTKKTTTKKKTTKKDAA